MKKAALLLVIALIIGACTRHGHMHYNSADEMVEKTMRQVKMMEPGELNDLMEAFETYTLIDVRQELEHYYGFIPGTVNIPREVLEFNIASPEFWMLPASMNHRKMNLSFFIVKKVKGVSSQLNRSTSSATPTLRCLKVAGKTGS
jgi:hypothetical protein